MALTPFINPRRSKVSNTLPKDGYTPIKGVDYFDGKDGVNGKDGINGLDGYTPIKGIDYFDGAKGDKGDQGIQGEAGTSGSGITAQTAIMTATQQNTTITPVNVTQLALAMEANAVYQVDAFIIFQSAATTTGAGIGFTSPSGCRCMLEVVVPITSTAVASQLRTIFPNATTAVNTGMVVGTGVTAINSNHTARISGIIRNGATAGNFQVQFRSEVAASAITLQIGSELQLVRIA